MIMKNNEDLNLRITSEFRKKGLKTCYSGSCLDKHIINVYEKLIQVKTISISYTFESLPIYLILTSYLLHSEISNVNILISNVLIYVLCSIGYEGNKNFH